MKENETAGLAVDLGSQDSCSRRVKFEILLRHTHSGARLTGLIFCSRKHLRAGGRSLKRVFQATGLDEIKGESEEKGGEGRRAEGRPQRPELEWRRRCHGDERSGQRQRGVPKKNKCHMGARGLQCCCQCHSRSRGTGKKAAVAGGRVARKLKL